MEDALYDTSWTLYFVSNAGKFFQNLTISDEHDLNRRAKRLRYFLDNDKPAQAYDGESETERTGGLRDCTWTKSSTTRDLISLIYDKATYKFVLCSRAETNAIPLLLAKAPAPTLKRFTNFLVESYQVTVDLLKVPQALLQNTLQAYLTILHSTPNILRSVLGNLKITLAFSAPVAPQLKILDLDIPPETVTKFLDTTNNSPRASTRRTPTPDTFLTLVAQRLQETSGIKVPMSATNGEELKIRISKVTSASFAIGGDGRLKFASRAVEVAVQHEMEVKKANQQMLDAIVEEAERRAKDG